MDSVREDPSSVEQLECDALLGHLTELQFDDIFQHEAAPGFVAEDDGPSPNPVLSEIENLLMADDDDDDLIPAAPPSESDYDKLLGEILGNLSGGDSDGGSDPSKGSNSDGVDASNPEGVVGDLSLSKKQTRQMRNRDAAVRSRERKKLYVKDLEMKSRYYEGECRRLGHLLQCCYAENHALRLCLQARGAFNASMTKQESAVLFLESLLLGSLLWFMGVMCHLNLPLVLLTAVLPRENMEQKDPRTGKGPERRIPEYFWLPSFTKTRRCRASRTKMKWDFLVLYNI